MANEADDLLKHGREEFTRCADGMSHNHDTGKADLTFARLGDHWDPKVRKAREADERPCLSIPKLPAFMRQVINDARQNKPSIKVQPVDSGADPETAEVIGGLIHNIESVSNADIAYDRGMECAVGNGFGYWRVVSDYAYDDSFDMDLAIKSIANPFSVFGDPNSTEADSSDWDVGFITDRLSKDQFEHQYGEVAKTSWDDESAWGGTDWRDNEGVIVAEWWTREKVDKPVVLLSDGSVRAKEDLETDELLQVLLATGTISVKAERITKACKVKQRIMSGAEVLKTTDWPGRYIPIVPVYGDEFDIEGKRYFRSLIHDSIDAQRLFSYWRTAGAELVALAPRVPFIGPVGAFNTDIDKWNTANKKNHPFLQYDVEGVPGTIPPQRQMLDTGAAAGALQEALNASDDMKAIMGLYDASLGQRSNETSGRAIMARQREGDVATFHFIDNTARAIRHTGRILIDLIPHFYNTARVVRVLGEDKSERMVQINQAYPKQDEKTGEPMREPEMGPDGKPAVDPMSGEPMMKPMMAMHNLTVGKYDLVVSSGPGYTTKREETAIEMSEALRSFPDGAPAIVPRLAKLQDWPEADEIGEELEKLFGPKELPPEVMQQMEAAKQEIAKLQEENAKLKGDMSLNAAELKMKAEQGRAELALKVQVAEQEAAAEEKIELIRIASQERIAMNKARSDASVAAFKAKLMADVQAARPQAATTQ